MTGPHPSRDEADDGAASGGDGAAAAPGRGAAPLTLCSLRSLARGGHGDHPCELGSAQVVAAGLPPPLSRPSGSLMGAGAVEGSGARVDELLGRDGFGVARGRLGGANAVEGHLRHLGAGRAPPWQGRRYRLMPCGPRADHSMSGRPLIRAPDASDRFTPY